MTRTRLRPVSRKRAAKLREEAPVRDVIHKRSKGRCELRIPGVCTDWAQGLHHLKKRSQGGETSVGNCLAACNRCNAFVECHPAAAREMGISVGRYKC